MIINTEVRSIPVTKKGVYFAFRDQGACISLLAIRVYYITCPEVTASFAVFPATPTGRELTSIEQANGVCVANAVQDAPPKYLCKGDGNWYLLGGGCLCKPGYEANQDKHTCNGQSPLPPRLDSVFFLFPSSTSATTISLLSCRSTRMWQRRLFFWFSLQKQTKQTGTIDGQLIIDTEATEVVHGGGGGGGGGHLHRLSVGLSTISFLIISLSIGTQTWPLEMRLSARHTPTHTLTMRHFFNRFFSFARFLSSPYLSLFGIR